MSNSFLTIEGVNKVYKGMSGKETIALKDVNLNVKEGEFISIIGPSGCGKSTLLKLISNLDPITSGIVKFSDNQKVEENIGFVFQDSVLLPWKTVYENAVFPLKIKGIDTKENLENLDKLLELAGLKDFKNALPKELSGGMRQRVSIVRSLSYNPKLLLMDEPFGALDAMTRDTLNMELLKIWSETKKTILFVTHGIDEAVLLSDRVVVMSSRPGQIKEILNIDIERPRNIDVRQDKKFIEYTSYLRGILS